jgi:hypothetical protein
VSETLFTIAFILWVVLAHTAYVGDVILPYVMPNSLPESGPSSFGCATAMEMAIVGWRVVACSNVWGVKNLSLVREPRKQSSKVLWKQKQNASLCDQQLLDGEVSDVRRRDEKCTALGNQLSSSVIYNYYQTVLLIHFPCVPIP